MAGLKPCESCSRHVRTTERACPFCGEALTPMVAIEELRLLSRLDRHRMVALGAVLSAAGIALGCREAPVAIYGAPAAAPHEVTSGAPPAPPVLEPAPSASEPAPPVSASAAPHASTAPAPVPAPTHASKPQPTASSRPFPPAAAYGAPPSMLPAPGIAPGPGATDKPGK